MRNQKSKKRRTNIRKRLIMSGISIISTLTLIFIGRCYFIEDNYNSKIYPGVYIEGIDVSNKTISEAVQLVIKKYQKPIITKKIIVKTDKHNFTLNYEKLQAEYNISEVVQEGFNYGKKGSIVERYNNIRNPSTINLKLSFFYSQKAIDEILNEIEKTVNINAVNASIKATNGIIKITSEVDGEKLDREKLKNDIQEQINNGTLTGEVKINAPMEINKAKITKEKLEAINTSISTFNTNFATSTSNRASNIELAVKAINGTLLMPGESFSFNKIVGERTKEKGYKEAGVIVGDKVESGIGGGICQVSSTLYNAILRTGIKSDERSHHTLPLGYIGKGLDATVDWGNIDYKFKNTLNYPIFIEGYTLKGKVYFNIYSNKQLTIRTYEISTDVYETLQPSIKYTDDSSMPTGQQQNIKTSLPGYKVKVYRKTYENGKVINTDLISNDFYQPVDGQVLRGTKKVS